MNSKVDVLLFVVDLSIKLVEVSDQRIFLERHVWRLVVWLAVRQLVVDLSPFFVVSVAVLNTLMNLIRLACSWRQL